MSGPRTLKVSEEDRAEMLAIARRIFHIIETYRRALPGQTFNALIDAQTELRYMANRGWTNGEERADG